MLPRPLATGREPTGRCVPMDADVTRIPLRNRAGDVIAHALIDRSDAPLIEGMGRWCIESNGYAVRSVGRGRPLLRMHRVLLDLPPHDPRLADHINHDRLDNRRANLRIVTKTENLQNRVSSPGTSSRYRGVHFFKGRWQARGYTNGKRHYLGTFNDEEEAGRVAREWRLANMPGAVD